VAVSFDEYLRRSQYDPSLRGRETQDIQSALQSISQYQTNRALGETLGVDADAKPREGVLRRFMGAIDAPRRAIAAGVLDLVGFDDAQLRRGNPLQSAIAGFRGDIDVSGGDVFRLTGREKLPAKALKLGGAFAFDVATDPITYIGTPAALGRKSASVMAARTAQRTLGEVVEQTAKAQNVAPKSVENNLVNRMFESSEPGRMWLAGDDTLRRRVFGPTQDDVLEAWRAGKAKGFERAGDTAEEALRKAAAAMPNAKQLEATRRRLLANTIDGMTDKNARRLNLIGGQGQPKTLEQWRLESARAIGMVDEANNPITAAQWKRNLAENELGRVLGESLYARGRVGLRESLTELTGNAEVADKIFLALPDRVKGGLYLANPLTGRSIMRITEGTGESLGAFGVAANRARVQLAAFFGKGTQHISGTKGKAFQMVRSDLAKLDPKVSLINVYGQRQQTLSGYLSKSTAERLSRLATIPGIRELGDVASDLSVMRRTAVNVEDFDRQVADAFYGRPSAPDAGDAAEISGRLRNVLVNMRSRMLRAGIDVGNLGEGYIPLTFTSQGAQRFKIQKALSEGAPTRTAAVGSNVPFDTTKARSTNFAILENADDAALYGIDLGRGMVAFTPEYANVRALAQQISQIVGDNPSGQKALADFFNGLPAGFRIPDAADDVSAFLNRIEATLLGANVRKLDLSEIVVKTFEEDPLTLIRRYVESSSPRIAAAELINQGLRLGILTRTSSEFTSRISERQSAEFIAGLRELTDRVQARLNMMAKGDSQFARKLADAVDPETGIISPQELEAIGLLSPSKMSAMIRELNMNAFLPDSALQEAALYEAVANWSRLNYARRAGQTLSAADAANLKASETMINGVAETMGNADRIIQSIDDMFANVMGTKNFTKYEMRAIANIVSSEFDKLSAQSRRSLERAAIDVSEQDILDAAARAIRERGSAPMPLTEVDAQELAMLESFLTRSKNFTAKASDEQIEAVVKKFYQDRDVQSPVDRAAELMGLGRIGARPSAEGVVSVGPELANLRAMQGVRELFEARQRVSGNPSAMAEFFEKVYDPLFLVWKNGATVGRGPGYTFLNMVGNLYMNMLGDVTIKDHKISARVLQSVTDSYNQAGRELAERTGLDLSKRESRAVVGKRADEILKKSLGTEKIGDKTLYELWTEFVNAGGVDSSQIGEALASIGKSGVDVTPEGLALALNRVRIAGDPTVATRRVESVVNAFMNNPYQQFANSVNTNVESWTRFASFIDGYRASGSIDMAMERMYLLQFNYGDLSRMDQAARRVFPFYVWTRNNVPAQIRAMLIQPGKIRRMMAAQESFKQALIADDEDAWLQEVLPDYIGEVGGFASAITSGPYNVAFSSKLPYDDVDRLIQFGGRFGLSLNARDIGQMLGPYTLGLEAIFQRDFSTGGAFDPLGREATGWRRGLAALPGIGSTGRYGEARLSTPMDKFLTELVPQIGTAERALSGLATGVRGVGGERAEGLASAIESPTSSAMRERGMSNLLNVSGVSPLFGVSATTLTPRTISSSLRDRRGRQLAEINQAAGRAGVSVEWLREQLRKGYTPEQIAVMVAGGQGRIEDYEAARAERSQGANPRYAGLLDQLRQGGPVGSLGY